MTAFAGRKTRNFEQDHDGPLCVPDMHGYCPCPLELAPVETAALVCSDTGGTVTVPGDPWMGSHDSIEPEHLPVFDLDFPCTLRESSPGKFHLYADKPVAWDQYLAVLKAMADAGLVQWGYYNASQERGFASLRHPDRPKECVQL